MSKVEYEAVLSGIWPAHRSQRTIHHKQTFPASQHFYSGHTRKSPRQVLPMGYSRETNQGDKPFVCTQELIALLVLMPYLDNVWGQLASRRHVLRCAATLLFPRITEAGCFQLQYDINTESLTMNKSQRAWDAEERS